MPSILLPSTDLFSSVPAYGVTQLGLGSYPSGSFVLETPSTSFSLIRSDKPVYATASIRPTGPCNLLRRWQDLHFLSSGYDRYGQFNSSFLYQQARRDPFPHLVMFDSQASPLVRGSDHSPSEAYSRLSERDSRPPISSESANIDRVVPPPRDRETFFRLWGTPEVKMFATVSNSHLSRFMSPILEPRALAVDTLSPDWQGRSMYMFPPFSLLNKVIQKLRSIQAAEVILVAPWWPKQLWFSTPTSSLCGSPQCAFPTVEIFWLSCDTIKQQAFQTMSLGLPQPLRGPQPIACTTIGSCTSLFGPKGKGLIRLIPQLLR